MFRVRRIHDDVLPLDDLVIKQVQAIMRAQFPALRRGEARKLPDALRNPLKYQFRTILFVADNPHGRVQGFATLLHEGELGFCYLDYISAATGMTGRGIGGALYRRAREEAVALGVPGIFMECLPDDPALCRDTKAIKQNRARLRFYERFGARPIVNTAYETPLGPDDDSPPYLVFDPLGGQRPLRRDHARDAARAVLERKYGDLCPQPYIDRVVESFAEDPIQLRPPAHEPPLAAVAHEVPPDARVLLIANDRHEIHHVRERGYVESPARPRVIAKALARTGLFESREPTRFAQSHLEAVHDKGYLRYFKKVCESVPADKAVYPYVFPIRNATRPPEELAVRAGYYCIDTFTPLNGNAYIAARRAVDCTLTAAKAVLEGRRLAYALVRPPGHHAERSVFGGFCYFNNVAVAAHYLSHHGKVAILDVDYHHGNGQQEIFYERSEVLTISIHGHPSFAYPYFSGFAEERGSGPGAGFNRNYPLPEKASVEQYRETLGRALVRVRRFKPSFLLVALGLDTAHGDPTGTWSLKTADFEENGRRVGALHLPTLVVQEGGYDTRVLGRNAAAFFSGLWTGANPGVQLGRGGSRGASLELPSPGGASSDRSSKSGS